MYLLLMLALNPEADARWRRPSPVRMLVLLILVSAALLVTERCRGESPLQSWKAEMAAQGEVFEATNLWPAVSPASVEFSNRLGQVLKRLPRALWNYGGQIESIVEDAPGKWRRGSQEPEPVLWYNRVGTNSWENFQSVLTEAEPALQSLRELMQEPPTGIDYQIAELMDKGSIHSFINTRLGAQALGGAAIFELHQGNLERAVDNLVALQGFVKLGADDPALVALMIRVAIVGLSVDINWDALQADGWTEPELARLQRACEESRRLYANLPRAMQASAAERLGRLEWLRSHSLDVITDRIGKDYQSFGLKRPADPDWQQWVFHSVWSAAWAEEEEFEFLQQMQKELAVLREAQPRKSWQRLKQQITALHKAYRVPTNAWRFYGKLPGDEMFEVIRPPNPAPMKAAKPEYPYTDLRRAWFSAMQNLTHHEMVVSAIALKRYELKHGKRAGTLGDLVPEFLASLPRDYMDGQPLRYRPNPDGDFALYSVGDDFKDDNGDPRPILDLPKSTSRTPWNATDWVWPHAVPREGDAKGIRASLQN